VFLDEFGGTLFTIAKDVKIQVEFNPAIVKAYRLIGYENRMLTSSDFNNDTTDAGEMGSGQTVTAFYEFITTASSAPIPGVDSLRYQTATIPAPVSGSSEFMFVKIRYKDPVDSVSKLLTYPVGQECFTLEPSSDFLFATSVVEAGLLLRPSKFKGSASFNHVISVAEKNIGTDPDGYRSEFALLMRSAYNLQKMKGD
jgi:Ca-activated chloride channel homolog